MFSDLVLIAQSDPTNMLYRNLLDRNLLAPIQFSAALTIFSWRDFNYDLFEMAVTCLCRDAATAEGPALLAGLVAARTPRPHIAAEAPWTEIGPIARQLLDRAF